MRGRKRQRKKDAKKRGIWGAPVIFTAKRRHEQPIADMLTKVFAHQFESVREAFYAKVVHHSMAYLTPRIPSVSEIANWVAEVKRTAPPSARGDRPFLPPHSALETMT